MITSNQFNKNKNSFGIYIIRNLVNNKCYIGSTILSFLIRKNSHYADLKNNKHKNLYLQNSYNKYGGDNFEFDILEITVNKEFVLEREQFWLDNYRATLYNINKKATSINSIGFNNIKEVIERRSKSIAESQKIRVEWYKKVRDNIIIFEDVPDKFKRAVKSYMDYIPPNKGKKISEKLRLKLRNAKLGKKFSEEQKSKRKEIMRENLGRNIYVYSKNIFLGKFRSAKDLEEVSNSHPEAFSNYIKSRFFGPKSGVPITTLQSVNITKSANHKITYKGLLFSFVPLHEEIHVEKQGKIGEGLTANTEVSSEITKGSETP